MDGSAKGLVCTGKGEEGNKWILENRECVTINLFDTLPGLQKFAIWYSKVQQ